MVGFLSKNPSYPIFYPKYLKNLVKPICGLTKRKKSTQNQLETKNLSKLISIFLGVQRKKEHLILTLLII
jgi:hypothetical protein